MWHKYFCLFEAPGWVPSLDVAGGGRPAGDSEVHLVRRALDGPALGMPEEFATSHSTGEIGAAHSRGKLVLKPRNRRELAGIKELRT